MGEGYRIRSARREDAPHLPEIERAAGERFATTGEDLGGEELGGPDWFLDAQQRGLLWVAVDRRDLPIGFALFEAFPESLHLEEIDVHPDHAGHGLGRRLLRAGAETARRRGYERITLTTFRWVPWNAPYYERLGFRELPPTRWDAALRERVRHETAEGLDPARRLVMEWRLSEQST